MFRRKHWKINNLHSSNRKRSPKNWQEIYSADGNLNKASERIHKIKCKNEHDDQKGERNGVKYNNCEWFLEYTNFKDDLLEHKCLFCNENYKKKFWRKLNETIF